MKEYRIEEDLLGKKEVPNDVYYGVQTLRAMENFKLTGYKMDRDFIKALGIVKKAAAKANMEIGLLDEKRAKAIMDATQEVIDGKLNEEFVLDPIQGGAGTSNNMNANEVIANRAIEIYGEGERGDTSVISSLTHVNMSQSTNDAVPTAIKIALLIKSQALLEATDKLEKSFRTKAKELDHVLKMGRTHLQDAVPIRLGQEFLAHTNAAKRSRERIARSIEGLKTINMGATAVGTCLNAEPEYIKLVEKILREMSGFDLLIAEDLVDATQNADAYVEASSAIKAWAVVLSKICNDLRLMASGPRAGLYEIRLPEVQPGSSIMPGKVNPVILEATNQVVFQIIGNDVTINLAAEAGQLELNVMEPVLAFNLMQSFDLMTNVQNMLREKCIDGIIANEQRCREFVERSIGIITALNPHIGYEKTCLVAREAFLKNKSVREVVLKHKIMDEDKLNKILDPYEMTKVGIAGKELLKN
ncbi:MAG: aspartate ammonia-lyase [Atribacterota bacterium]|nr:aspartate ammonia-lyase [Atribacterota bacterium]MDD4895894.1 aspartate ammonia-lyase [Atribacterota bacterium]MDD5636773.1 aspartate ammonia-lyase [Atribacterota bacterium]